MNVKQILKSDSNKIAKSSVMLQIPQTIPYTFHQ